MADSNVDGRFPLVFDVDVSDDAHADESNIVDCIEPSGSHFECTFTFKKNKSREYIPKRNRAAADTTKFQLQDNAPYQSVLISFTQKRKCRGRRKGNYKVW